MSKTGFLSDRRACVIGKNDNREILGIMDPEGQESPEGGEVDMEAWERNPATPNTPKG